MKRKLTQDEIHGMCDIIPLNQNIPFETASCVRKGVQDGLRKQLDSVEIYPDLIHTLYKTIEQEYYKTVLQPGEMVGVQSATSIGEPVSQMTLNAFHFSGISSIGIASGVPRVEEILNASKKQKSYGMTLYTKEKMEIRELRRQMMKTLVEIYVSDIIDHYTVDYIGSFDKLDAKDQLWYKLYLDMYCNEIMPDDEWLFPWRIRLNLNKKKMYQHSISCLSMVKRIEDSYRDLYVVASPDNIGIVDIYIDFSQIKMKKKEEEDTEHLEPFKEGICLRNIILPCVMDILVSGIHGIEQIFIREDKGEWLIDTQGSNLMAVFTNELLDERRCQCSDIWEIRKLLGIEATRQFIINEFYKVLSVSGASVGRRHIELLADSMTFQGKINSVNRYGIDRNETGPLAKASFEESVSNFFIAAVNNEKDEMGVSSSIMAGKMAEFGTGYFDLVLDMNVKETFPVPDPIQERMDAKQEQAKLVLLSPVVNPIANIRIPPRPIRPSQPIQEQVRPRQEMQDTRPETKQNMGYIFNYTLGGTLMGNVHEHKKPEPYHVPYTRENEEEKEKQTVSWIKRKKVTVSFTDE